MDRSRRTPRFETKLPLRYKLEDREDEVSSLIENINMGGIQIKTSERFPLGEQVNLSIEIPDIIYSFNAKGQVCWQKRIDVEKESFATGIRFMRLRDLDKERIYQYLFRTKPEELTRRWWQEFS